MQSNTRPDLPLSARIQQDLKNDLIAGLLVVIPLATTFWLATTVSRIVLAFLTSIPKQLNPFTTLTLENCTRILTGGLSFKNFPCLRV